MSKNQLIIDEFEKLLQQIEYDIDHATDKNERTTNLFRLKQIEKALNFIKKYDKKITSGKQLEDVEGIGKGVMRRIDEILENGYLKEITLKTEDVNETKYVEILKEVYGIGDKTAFEFVRKGIKSIDDLKKAVETGKIEVNSNIQMGLKYVDKYKQHIPREEMKQMDKYLHRIVEQIGDGLEIIICGSYRRKKDFSNDIDCMLTCPRIMTQNDLETKKNYLHEFINLLREDLFIVDALTSDDVETKFMGFCHYSKDTAIRRIDIRYIPYESYYPALLYFTGSGNFNQEMRTRAKKMGYKLNEYGLYKKTGEKYKKISVSSEEDIFNNLGMLYVTPEKRI